MGSGRTKAGSLMGIQRCREGTLPLCWHQCFNKRQRICQSSISATIQPYSSVFRKNKNIFMAAPKISPNRCDARWTMASDDRLGQCREGSGHLASDARDSSLSDCGRVADQSSGPRQSTAGLDPCECKTGSLIFVC